MYFVGIITDEKSRRYIKKIINEQIRTNKFQIIFISEKNAENMKNIFFDIIVINKNVQWLDLLKNNLENTKIIINSDINIDFNILEELSLRVISYGFNSKATITISSNTEDNVQICIQRNILTKEDKIEQQEISVIKNENTNIYDIMILVTILLIYEKDIISLLKL